MTLTLYYNDNAYFVSSRRADLATKKIHGRASTKNDPHSGRLKTVAPDSKKVNKKNVLADRHVMVRFTAEKTKISIGSVLSILHERLRMKKVSECRSPKMFTDAQYETGLIFLYASLELLQKDPDSFLARFTTMDERYDKKPTSRAGRVRGTRTVRDNTGPSRNKATMSDLINATIHLRFPLEGKTRETLHTPERRAAVRIDPRVRDQSGRGHLYPRYINAEVHRILAETCGDNPLSDTTCRDWFRSFKNNDFEVEDKERSGAPKKFEDEKLEELLDQKP
ncbi:Mariner Mos1 transposase [Eumeta japonica]|uniref:Mariner Mos1 transposase n=1 Tax=Eumeta variegata TaxID=151549 RepID=A0A4C1V4Z4_EUMVA|nr:Mariner Mos1 transposase [Eumeta japonica]